VSILSFNLNVKTVAAQEDIRGRECPNNSPLTAPSYPFWTLSYRVIFQRQSAAVFISGS
jgi:hypothetical protein